MCNGRDAQSCLCHGVVNEWLLLLLLLLLQLFVIAISACIDVSGIAAAAVVVSRRRDAYRCLSFCYIHANEWIIGVYFVIVYFSPANRARAAPVRT